MASIEELKKELEEGRELVRRGQAAIWELEKRIRAEEDKEENKKKKGKVWVALDTVWQGSYIDDGSEEEMRAELEKCFKPSPIFQKGDKVNWVARDHEFRIVGTGIHIDEDYIAKYFEEVKDGEGK